MALLMSYLHLHWQLCYFMLFVWQARHVSQLSNTCNFKKQQRSFKYCTWASQRSSGILCHMCLKVWLRVLLKGIIYYIFNDFSEIGLCCSIYFCWLCCVGMPDIIISLPLTHKKNLASIFNRPFSDLNISFLSTISLLFRATGALFHIHVTDIFTIVAALLKDVVLQITSIRISCTPKRFWSALTVLTVTHKRHTKGGKSE